MWCGVLLRIVGCCWLVCVVVGGWLRLRVVVKVDVGCYCGCGWLLVVIVGCRRRCGCCVACVGLFVVVSLRHVVRCAWLRVVLCGVR